MQGQESKWQRVIDQELSTRDTSLPTGRHALRVAHSALQRELSERDCIVKMGMEGHHPLAVRDAMLEAGYFKGRNPKSMTAMVYSTFLFHDLKFERTGNPTKKKPVQSVDVHSRVERMFQLIQVLHKPIRLSKDDVLARRDAMRDAG